MHHYGECDGKTEAQLRRLDSQRQQPEKCVGDAYYNACKKEHGECVGREFAEAVYELEGI